MRPGFPTAGEKLKIQKGEKLHETCGIQTEIRDISINSWFLKYKYRKVHGCIYMYLCVC